MGRIFRSNTGFTLVELVIVAAIIGTLSAIGIPLFDAYANRMRLNQSAREVERAIQNARTKAVTNSRAMRIRFDCPGPGQFRVVEVVGVPSAPTAADDATNRCSPAVYPFPPADTDPATRPNLDGPVQQLGQNMSFGSAQTLEFWPDGTAHALSTTPPGPLLPTTGTSLTVSRTVGSHTRTATITVNGIGKITLNPIP